MKKLLIITAFMIAFLSSANETYAQCYANEMTSLSVNKDDNCESVEFYHYNTVSIYVYRNGTKQGKFRFKWRKNATSQWANLPIEFNIDSINGNLYTSFFKATNNGEYRCIFYETGTGCRDTLYTTITVNKAPKPGIGFDYTCYGGLFTIEDARNPSGVGNSYAQDSGGGYWIPCNKTIPAYCNGCVYITHLGGPQVKVTTSLGCSATTFWSGSIFNSFPPVYTITASQNPISPGQSTVLSASSNYAVSNYKWYRTGSSIVLGTDSVYTVTYPDTGKYKVRIRNSNAAGACLVNKFITVSGSAAARIDDAVYNDELIVYPNPASDIIQISGHEGNVEIIDVLGKVILTATNTEPTFTININPLRPGVYLLRSADKTVRFYKQ